MHYLGILILGPHGVGAPGPNVSFKLQWVVVVLHAKIYNK